MTKNAARREKFRKIGEAISKIGDPDVNDYATGKASMFEPRSGDQRQVIPCGPRFKTPQWIRSTAAK
jgi:hypothetical protein